MKKLIALIGLFAAFTFSAMGQESAKAATPTDKDKTEAIPSDGYLKRGTAIGNSKKVSLNKLMKDPAKFTGKTVRKIGRAHV